MGIPSYFRGILTKYPGCLIKQVKADVLAFDFNCLIYRCLRGPSMPVYSVDTHDDWESALLKEVERSVKEIWTYAGKPKKVLLAVDGVVPMAKIRQQRVRRFKSVWLRKGSSWDTNAITPGTEFMDKLGIMLKGMNKSWIVSGVDEEGEGEHKIMDFIRNHELKGKVVVYGLDADLILLSMLTGEKCELDLFLLREVQEFGKVREAATHQEYQYLNIREFQARLGLVGYDATLNYIGYMSLMGNDFLPHSLTHKLSDDGHEFIMDCVKRDLVSGTRLITDGKVCLRTLKGVFETWSSGGQEEDRLLYLIRKKREQAVRGVGKGMAEEEGLALKWDVEAAFLDGSKLRDNWQHVYWTFLHSSYDVNYVCKEYIKGFQWIIDYYTGRPVNKTWIFPAWLPPLWSDLATFLESDASLLIDSDMASPEPIKPQEQLAMVLPLESWGLIRDPKLRRLPVAAPQMWPKAFGFVSVGRKWLWECEARIPVLTAERVRQICEEN